MTPAADPTPTLPLTGKISLILLAGFAALLTVLLWPEWRHNPDLTHGLFLPLLFVLLLHESRTRGTRRYLSSSPLTRFLRLAVPGLALALLAAAGLYAAALGWSHPLVEFLLTVSLVFLLTAGVLTFSSASFRLIPCNWSAFAAIGLWLISAPLPPGTYTRLTVGLQLWVTENVLRTLHLLGIAAFRSGNIIELARGSVGVEEACSGVRSLLSCVFAGLFFSATLVRRPWARLLIVAGAVPLALGLNFFRSLLLTLLANSGVQLAAAWHDLTGYAVLAVASVVLAALAFRLEARPAVSAQPEIPPPSAPRRPARPASLGAFAGTLFLSGVLLSVFALNTRPLPRSPAPAPDLAELLPSAPDGWQATSPADLAQFSGTLETRHLAQRTYLAPSVDAAPVQITFYLAYWPAGQSTVGRVAAHTPDACWPGSGWQPQPASASTVIPILPASALPAAEYRFFTRDGLPQHVWFWHLFGGRPITYETPDSPRELLRLAWRYGFRRNGDQLFVRVSSNRPWSEIAANPILRDFFARLSPLGL